MLIDCGSCAMRDIACSECVVTHFLGLPEQRELREREERALEVLSGAGLVPPLRMTPEETRTQRRTGS